MVIRLVAALTAVLLLAGCAGNQASDSGADPPPAASASPSAEPDPSAAATLSGTIAEGVEPNCPLLEGAGRTHLPIFDDPSLKSRATVGATVTVVGVAEPAQMTTCQQGIPFLVSSIRVD
jgi:hypothetical protein